MIDTSFIENMASNSNITSLDCNEVLGLLAVGCSDGRVHLYDT